MSAKNHVSPGRGNPSVSVPVTVNGHSRVPSPTWYMIDVIGAHVGGPIRKRMTLLTTNEIASRIGRILGVIPYMWMKESYGHNMVVFGPNKCPKRIIWRQYYFCLVEICIEPKVPSHPLFFVPILIYLFPIFCFSNQLDETDSRQIRLASAPCEP